MVKRSKSFPEDEPVRIRFRGTYDYDELLAVIRAYFKKSLFIIREPKFKYKTNGSGAEVEFKFESDREITEYIAIELEVLGHLWDVKRDDKGVTSGKLEIFIQASAVFDYAEKFKDDKHIHKWMQQTLDAPGSGLQFGDNKVTGEKYAEKLVQQLQFEIKKHLKMECV